MYYKVRNLSISSGTMLCFKATFAAVITSLFALVVSESQRTNDVSCDKTIQQNISLDDCFSALLEFATYNNAITFKPSGDAHCVRTCEVILKQVAGSGSNIQGIPKPEVQENLQVALNNCGRKPLISIFASTSGVTASLEVKDSTGKCIERS